MNEAQALEQLFKMVKGYLEENPDKVVEYLPPKALQEELALATDRPTEDFSVLINEIEKYLQYAVRTRHPQYLNQLWSGFSMPVFMGEVIAALCNTSMYTYEVAPVATVLEKKLITELLEIIGFDQGEGQLTTGGSNGNMLAMMISRNQVVKDCKEKGLDGSRLVAFVSAESHYSFDKAANILGLGLDCLVKVPVDSTGKMDPAALKTAIETAKTEGRIPFFVGATAGTTIRGVFDDIEALGKVAREYDCWFHVDGAWGGSVILSSDRAKHLKGIETVDSFVWDAHKMMGVSLMCSLFAVRERGHFDRTFNLGDTSYIFHQDDDHIDLGPRSVQCGRRNDILKFWLEWCYTGRKGFQKRIDTFLDLMAYAQAQVKSDPDLELVAEDTPLSVCFRFTNERIPDLNAFNIEVRRHLHEAGDSFVNYGYLGETAVVRLVIANKDLQPSDIDTFFKNFKNQAHALL